MKKARFEPDGQYVHLHVPIDHAARFHVEDDARTIDDDGTAHVTFWSACPGAVQFNDAFGRQVCERLKRTGRTLHALSEDDLLIALRFEWAALCRRLRDGRLP